MKGLSRMAAITLVSMLGLAAAFPLEAKTAPSQLPPPSAARGGNDAAKASLLLLAERLGIGDSTLHQISSNPSLVAGLEAVPPAADQIYKSMTPAEKLHYNERIHAKTYFLFWVIDNKKAFIRGSVMGHDVFENMQSRLDGQWADGEVSDEEYIRENSWINILSSITPGNRAALVTLMEMDTATFDPKSGAQAAAH